MSRTEANKSRTAAEMLAGAVIEVGDALSGTRDLEADLTGMSFRGPQEPGGEILVVLRAIYHDGTKVVAFHSAYSLGDCVKGIADRLRNGSLKWKPDEYDK